jgi:hypothetical protein
LEFLAREIRHEQEIKKDSTQEESQTILIWRWYDLTLKRCKTPPKMP